MYLNKPIEFWHDVLFTDESKYNIYGSDGRTRVWRRPNTAYDPKNTIKSVKHGGGNVLVWGCIGGKGVGNLEIIDGIMDHRVYIDILKRNLRPSVTKIELTDKYYFQQDNDPKHMAHNTRMYLAYNTPHMLNTPPQSPDLNPIEQVWAYLEKNIRKHHISSRQTLIDALKEEWEKLDVNFLKKIVESMPKRLKAVIDNKGYPTKY